MVELVLLAAVLAGCVHYRTPSEQALWEATRAARDMAERAREELGGPAIGRGRGPAGRADAGRAEFEATVGSDGRSSLLGSASRPDGSVQFDLAIVGGAETGGGLTDAAAGVLLCARVTATLGRDARAAVAGLLPSPRVEPGQPEGTCRRGLGRRCPSRLVRSCRTGSWARHDQAPDSLPTAPATSGRW